MEKITATKIEDKLFDYALDVTAPCSAGSARIAKVLIEADAKALERAVNCYEGHIAILEEVQRVLANFHHLSHHPAFRALADRTDRAILAHHEYLEQNYWSQK